MRRSGWSRAARLLAVAALALTLACRERSGQLRLVFSADTQGLLKDCGCGTEALGGLARRADLVGRLRAQGGPPLLLIDGGNLHHVQRDAAAQRGAAEIVRIMNRLGYQLAVLGPKDYQLPADERSQLLRGANFAWLGGAYRGARAALGVDTLWVKELGGLVVGVLDMADSVWVPNHLAAAAADDGLLRRARLLRPLCDVLVVVAAVDPRAPETLARSLEGLVDFLLVTGAAEAAPRAQTVGTVMIASVGDQGRNLGSLELTVERGRLTRREWTLLPVDSRLEDPIIAEMVREHTQKEEGLERSRRERLRLSQLVRRHINPTTLPGDTSLSWYVGEKSCRPCHAAQSEAWRTSAHAAAYAELLKVGGGLDDARLRRAVTGWLEKGGWLSREESQHLLGVQCEACHGRASMHVATKGELVVELGQDPAGTCGTCHQDIPPAVDPHRLTLRP